MTVPEKDTSILEDIIDFVDDGVDAVLKAAPILAPQLIVPLLAVDTIIETVQDVLTPDHKGKEDVKDS